MTENLMAQGSSMIDAQRQAVGLVARIIQQQSSILAYIEVFRIYAVFAIVMVAVAFLLKRVEHSRPEAAETL